MKTLLLMRHAKSSWKENDLPDHERPLNKRGEKDAPRMGKLIRKEELEPDLILASPAVRSRVTAEAVAEKLGDNIPIEYIDSLYMGEPDDVLEVLRGLSEEVETVLVVGHNPGLETVLQILSGKVESLPTGAVAHIRLPIRKWSVLSSELDGKLLDLWRPKEL